MAPVFPEYSSEVKAFGVGAALRSRVADQPGSVEAFSNAHGHMRPDVQR